jgi:hypothetical protein
MESGIMKAPVCVVTIAVLGLTFGAAAAPPGTVKNVVVYKEAGRFGGWPANNGLWAWGDEIVVGFIQGTFKAKRFGHAIDEEKPMTTLFARSLDGGETWQVETPAFSNAEPMDCPGGIDFTAPDFVMALRMVNSEEGYSRFYCSTDRCHIWTGPYKLPTFDRKTVSARTDYQVLGPHDLIAFMTAAKDNGREGRPFCTRTTDGGKTWGFVSWITPEPRGYAIMPSTVRLGPESFLTAIRREEGRSGFIDLYRTDDTGKNWQFMNKAVERTGDNPPAMIKLKDGRIALSYGYREAPYGLRAKISDDDGKTWGDEIILRQDGGSWDLGYPRIMQRTDGKLVNVYYFNDAPDQERYIGATIWEPGTPEK